MDQVKIGIFIAELRKEQGMTQKQLAESINVSDKTISKWECGNGLPEMSSIPVLCEALGINVNELLSGERLMEENYSKKAEENMMTLMKETAEQKKKNQHSLITLVGYLLCMVITLAFSMSFGMFGVSVFKAFLDVPSLLMLLIPTFFVLASAGMLNPFFWGFAMLGSKSGNYTSQQLEKSKQALRLGANSFLVVGSMEALAVIIVMLGYYRKGMTVDLLLANIAVALLGFLYGLLAYLLLLPIRCRLETLNEE